MLNNMTTRASSCESISFFSLTYPINDISPAFISSSQENITTHYGREVGRPFKNLLMGREWTGPENNR
jgi:hypothetical protein